MSSYKDTDVDLIQLPKVKQGVPYIIDDFALAMHLGVRCRTLWYLIVNKRDMYTRFTIPKKTGGKRVIHAPDARLKYVQGRIDQVLLRTQYLSDSVGAYRPGRGCRESAERHAGHYVRVALDIHNFFPSHSRAEVRHFIRRNFGYDHRVRSMIADLCTVGERIVSKGSATIRERHATPQGSPASPTLCNLMAQESIDTPILSYLKDSGWVYTRYADDITLSHPEKKTRVDIQSVIDNVVGLIQAGGYRENRKKRRVQRQPAQQKMLGMVVNVHPNIPRYTYRVYRALLHNCLNHGFVVNAIRYGFDLAESTTGDDDDVLTLSFIAHLTGKINYFHSVNPVKAAKLRAKLDAAVTKHAPDA